MLLRKHRDLRWLWVWVGNLLLLWLAGLANHYLAPFSVYLSLSGLFVIFPALRLDVRHGFVAVLLTGLSLDAITPVPYGLHALLLCLAHAVILRQRQQFPRDEPIFGTVAALLANLGIFLLLSFFLIGRLPHPGMGWLRLFSDLIASQLVVALITPWFLALQTRLLVLARLDAATGARLED